MQTIVADYSGLILVLFILILISGKSIYFLIRNILKPTHIRKRSLVKVHESLRTAFSVCGFSFLILSIISTTWHQSYVWENIVSGFFCTLILLFLNSWDGCESIGGN